MNRLIICTILLALSQATLAEKLYRWIEPDGSITFSPTPPPSGVDYKAINSATGTDNPAAAQLSASTASQTPSILETSEHGLGSPAPRVNDTKIMTRPTAAVATQGLSYAPETGSNNGRIAAATATEVVQPARRNQGTVSSNNKRRQCEDLSKRVISLERRLRSVLAAEEMDNTVIAMARYQRSYDQHCVN